LESSARLVWAIAAVILTVRKVTLFSLLTVSFVYVATALSSDKDYHFGAASFSNELWLNNGTAFKKPDGANVEFITPGAFDWVFSDENGKEVRTLRSKNEHGGWTSMNFASLGLYGNYRIGFRNASTGAKEIKQGDVHLR
jgi:hypothetical protein